MSGHGLAHMSVAILIAGKSTDCGFSPNPLMLYAWRADRPHRSLTTVSPTRETKDYSGINPTTKQCARNVMIKRSKAKVKLSIKEDSLIRQLPPPIEVHRHIGRLSRELALARRLLRLSQAAAAEKTQQRKTAKEIEALHERKPAER